MKLGSSPRTGANLPRRGSRRPRNPNLRRSWAISATRPNPYTKNSRNRMTTEEKKREEQIHQRMEAPLPKPKTRIKKRVFPLTAQEKTEILRILGILLEPEQLKQVR